MKIDKETWPRREIFEFFSAISHPFYMVTFTVDVTELYRYAKEKGISFYYALVYLCTKALNRVENFRYAIREGEVHLLDGRIPSFTDMKKGSELFHIVTMPCEGGIDEFCRAAAERSRNQEVFINSSCETDELIYYSCLPWLEMTALTNEGLSDPDDAVPRISWGKYVEENGRKRLNISLEVNHRFIDGLHIGRFCEELTALMKQLGQK